MNLVYIYHLIITIHLEIFRCNSVLGAQTSTDQFAVTGTAAPALYGLCESQYNPDFTAEELVQTAGLKLIAIQQLLTVYILVSKSPRKQYSLLVFI